VKRFKNEDQIPLTEKNNHGCYSYDGATFIALYTPGHEYGQMITKDMIKKNVLTNQTKEKTVQN
jgi:hypothetical protein